MNSVFEKKNPSISNIKDSLCFNGGQNLLRLRIEAQILMHANKWIKVPYYHTYDLQDYENKILHFDNMI